jgi:hypothetical protein
LIFIPSPDKIIVSVHVVFNEVTHCGVFFRGSRSRDPQDRSHYDFLVGTKHIDDKDGLVYQTTRVVCERVSLLLSGVLLLLLVFKRNTYTPIFVTT